MGAETGISAHEALRRYHAAEMRLAEVERDIDAIVAWRNGRPARRSHTSVPTDAPFPEPDATLQALYLERERLQAESFRVFMASIGAATITETAREAYRECLRILVRLAEGARLVGDISAHTAFSQAHGDIRRAMYAAAGTGSGESEGGDGRARAQAGKH